MIASYGRGAVCDLGSERSVRLAAKVATTSACGAPDMVRRTKSKPDLAQPPLDSRDFRRLVDRQLSEKEWQKQVEEALDVYGWWWFHVPSNVLVCQYCRRKNYRGIKKGFPDILAIKPPRMLWIELKRERGWLDPDQRRVHEMLRACGQTVLHARPRDREDLFGLIAHRE